MKNIYGTGFRFADGSICQGLVNPAGEVFIAMYLFPKDYNKKPEDFIGTDREWDFGRLVGKLHHILKLSTEKWGYGECDDDLVTERSPEARSKLEEWARIMGDRTYEKK